MAEATQEMIALARECRNCAFAALPYVGTVECRRFPPSPYFEPTGRVTNIRPRIGDFYWCGEFQSAHLKEQSA